MKPKVLAMLAVALIAAVSLPAIAMATGIGEGATQANHPIGQPTTVPCTFSQPGSLPDQAASNATTALNDRSTHCPPTLPTQP